MGKQPKYPGSQGPMKIEKFDPAAENAKMAVGHADADSVRQEASRLRAENARLQERVEGAEAQLTRDWEGMKQQVNDFIALQVTVEQGRENLLVAAKLAIKAQRERDEAKALAERRKEALEAQKAAHDYRFGPAGEEAETGEEMNAFMLKAQELDETAWQLTLAALQGKKEPCPTCKGSRVVRSKGKQKNRLLSCPDCRESP